MVAAPLKRNRTIVYIATLVAFVLGALLALCAAAIMLGIRYGKFAFVTYGILYAYGAFSYKVAALLGDPAGIFFYGVISGTFVLVVLVALARRFGRDE